MKKSTTFFEAKFINYTGLMESSRFLSGSFVAHSSEFDVVVNVNVVNILLFAKSAF
jgi:hypothetical protein